MKISDLIEKTTIETNGVVITLRRELSWFEYSKIQEIENLEERGLAAVVKQIDSWNITDDENNPLPITAENVRLLPNSVFQPVLDEISANFADAQKKRMASQKTPSSSSRKSVLRLLWNMLRTFCAVKWGGRRT